MHAGIQNPNIELLKERFVSALKMSTDSSFSPEKSRDSNWRMLWRVFSSPLYLHVEFQPVCVPMMLAEPVCVCLLCRSVDTADGMRDEDEDMKVISSMKIWRKIRKSRTCLITILEASQN